MYATQLLLSRWLCSSLFSQVQQPSPSGPNDLRNVLGYRVRGEPLQLLLTRRRNGTLFAEFVWFESVLPRLLSWSREAKKEEKKKKKEKKKKLPIPLLPIRSKGLEKTWNPGDWLISSSGVWPTCDPLTFFMSFWDETRDWCVGYWALCVHYFVG